jgi:hypothetical protein
LSGRFACELGLAFGDARISSGVWKDMGELPKGDLRPVGMPPGVVGRLEPGVRRCVGPKLTSGMTPATFRDPPE